MGKAQLYERTQIIIKWLEYYDVKDQCQNIVLIISDKGEKNIPAPYECYNNQGN